MSLGTHLCSCPQSTAPCRTAAGLSTESSVKYKAVTSDAFLLGDQQCKRSQRGHARFTALV
eukprot:1161782-Pelagomonas_calceolata.AAC.8